MANYPGTENDLIAIGGLTYDERCEAMYAYLVEGLTMAEVGESILGVDNDQPGRLPSSLMRCYGFSGRNGGRYPSVPQQLIERFVSECWPESEGLNPEGTFDSYVQSWRRSRQQEEARRNQQEARRREEEARRAREEEARRAREARQREEARRRREQEASNEAEARRLLASGREKLKTGRLQEAINALRASQNYQDTWEVRLAIAETLSRADNAGEHADEIIRLLEGYRSAYEAKMTPDHFLWLARAYAEKKDRSIACSWFFRAGDVYYDKEDYKTADACYTEGREKTNYYEHHHAFRVAFARSRSKPKPEEADHRFCIAFYERDIADHSDSESTYANLGYHHNELKEYAVTRELLLPRAERSQNKILLGNLASACYGLEDWEGAIRWYRRAAECGAEPRHYCIGTALTGLRRLDEALKEFLLFESEAEDPGAEAYGDLLTAIRTVLDDPFLLADRRARAVSLYPQLGKDADEAAGWYLEALEAGNRDAAARILDEVPGLGAPLAERKLAEARIAHARGDPEGAEALAQEACGFARTKETDQFLADLSYERKDWPEAERRYRALGEAWGEWDRFHLGYALMKQEKYDEAERSFLRYLEESPNSRAALQNLCYLSAQQELWEKLSAYRLRRMRLGELEDGEKWLRFAEGRGHTAAAEMLELLPEVKQRREQEARERAEQEAREKAEREAREKAEREAREKAEREARERAEREAREKARREAEEKRLEEEALLLLLL